MRKISNFLMCISLVLSHIMCVVVAYDYRDMLCGIEHSCYSAPAWVAFLEIVPFGIGIVICLALAAVLRHKTGSKR